MIHSALLDFRPESTQSLRCPKICSIWAQDLRIGHRLQQRLLRGQGGKLIGQGVPHHALAGGDQRGKILGAFVLEQDQRVCQREILLIKQTAEYLGGLPEAAGFEEAENFLLLINIGALGRVDGGNAENGFPEDGWVDRCRTRYS